MKRLLGILIGVAFCVLLQAQNHFVYLRYDETTNDYSLLKSKISDFKSKCRGRFVLFFDGKIYSNEEVDELLQQIAFLQNTQIYESVEEEITLSSWFEKTLDEHVAKDGRLYGFNDAQWQMTFITYSDASRWDLCQLIDIHGLPNRLHKLEFLVYDDETRISALSFQEYACPPLVPFVLNFK